MAEGLRDSDGLDALETALEDVGSDVKDLEPVNDRETDPEGDN